MARWMSAIVASWTLKDAERCALPTVAPTTIIVATTPTAHLRMSVHFMRAQYHYRHNYRCGTSRGRPFAERIRSSAANTKFGVAKRAAGDKITIWARADFAASSRGGRRLRFSGIQSRRLLTFADPRI